LQVRYTKGQDIAGACGQLSLNWQSEHQSVKRAAAAPTSDCASSCDCKASATATTGCQDSQCCGPNAADRDDAHGHSHGAGLHRTSKEDAVDDEVDEAEMNMDSLDNNDTAAPDRDWVVLNEARFIDPGCLSAPPSAYAVDTAAGSGDIEDLFLARKGAGLAGDRVRADTTHKKGAATAATAVAEAGTLRERKTISGTLKPEAVSHPVPSADASWTTKPSISRTALSVIAAALLLIITAWGLYQAFYFRL